MLWAWWACHVGLILQEVWRDHKEDPEAALSLSRPEPFSQAVHRTATLGTVLRVSARTDRPNKILTKHRCDSNKGLGWFCVWWREQNSVLGEATWVVPTLHPPLWGTNQTHLSGGLGREGWEAHSSFQILQTLFSSWFYTLSFLPLSLSSSSKAGCESSWSLLWETNPTHPLTTNLAITTQLGCFKYSEYLGVVSYFQETPVLVINKLPVTERNAFIQPESLSLVQYTA